ARKPHAARHDGPGPVKLELEPRPHRPEHVAASKAGQVRKFGRVCHIRGAKLTEFGKEHGKLRRIDEPLPEWGSARLVVGEEGTRRCDGDRAANPQNVSSRHQARKPRLSWNRTSSRILPHCA